MCTSKIREQLETETNQTGVKVVEKETFFTDI
jgi:hypothetical protein